MAFGGFAALVSVDLVSKLYVESAFTPSRVVTVIPNIFDIVYLKNRGAAFSFLGDVDSEWIPRGFTIVALLALAAIVILYRSLPREEVLSKIGFVLIGSGAFGNLLDRFRTGAVTDFLLFHIGEYHWPAFNVADSCITVGVCILAYSMLVKPSRPSGESEEPTQV